MRKACCSGLGCVVEYEGATWRQHWLLFIGLEGEATFVHTRGRMHASNGVDNFDDMTSKECSVVVSKFPSQKQR